MIGGCQGINPIVCVRLAGSTALVFALIGCASQKSAESHADYTAQTQTTRTEGAERVTVLEFGPVAAPQEKGAGVWAPAPSAGSFGTPVRLGNATLPAHGPLVKATITDRAPIVTETHSGTDLHTDAESASSRRFGPGFFGYMALAFGGVLALVLGYRFRAGLLGGVLRVLGRGG